MNTPKFGTMKISLTSASSLYSGYVQHESSWSKKETYAHLSDALHFPEANVKAAFLALGKALRTQIGKGNTALIEDVARVKTYVQGAFAGSTGPWVKGINQLVVHAVEADAFKGALSGVIPENITEGLSPAVTSVFDTVTETYDEITGTDLISIGGTNLGVDTTKSDEYVGVLYDDGTLVKLTLVSGTLTLITAKFAATPAKTGRAKLVVATRCGMGSAYGVKTATRAITVA